MGRVMIVFLLQTAILMAMLSQPVRAGDGDVDYSAPYITVDPKTGQLVTRNPGPHLKNHSMDMSGPAAAETPTNVAAVTPDNEPGIDTADQDAEGGSSPINAATLMIIVAGVFVFGTLAVKRMKQKQ